MLLVTPAVIAAWRWGGRNESDHLMLLLPVIVAGFLSLSTRADWGSRFAAPRGLVAFCLALSAIGALQLVQMSRQLSVQPGELSTLSAGVVGLTGHNLSGIPLTPASIDQNETRIRFAQFVAVLFALLAGFRLGRRREARSVVFALLLVNGVLVASAIVLGAPVWTASHRQREATVHGDVIGLFVNRGHAALFMQLAFAAGLGLLSQCSRDETPTAIRWAAYAGMIVVLAGIAGSGSISGVVTILVCCVAVGTSQFEHRGRVAGFVVAATAVLAAAFAMLEMVPAALLRAMRVEPVWASILVRWNHWADMAPVIGEFPLFGTGAGTYGLISPPFQRHASFGYFANADNLLFEQVVETGLIGGLLWMAAAGGLLGCLLARLSSHNSRESRGLGIAGLWALTAMTANSLVDFGLLLPANALAGALVVGCVLSKAPDRRHRVVGLSSPSFPAPSRFRVLGWLAVIVLLPWGPVAAFEMAVNRRADLALQRSAALPTLPQVENLSECRGQLRDALRVRATDPRLIAALADLTMLQTRTTIMERLRTDPSYAVLDESAQWAITSPQMLASILLYEGSDPLSQQVSAAIRADSVQKQLNVASELLQRTQQRSPFMAGVDLHLAFLGVLCGEPNGQVAQALRRSLWLQPTEFLVLKQSLLLGASLRDRGIVAASVNHILTCFVSDERKRRFATTTLATAFPDDCGWQVQSLRSFPEAMLDLLETPHADCADEVAAVACEVLTDALATDRDNAASHVLMARLQQFRGDHELQLAHLRAAVNLRPKAPTLRLQLAEALWSSGRIADAREQLVSAEALSRYRPDLRERIETLRKQIHPDEP